MTSGQKFVVVNGVASLLGTALLVALLYLLLPAPGGAESLAGRLAYALRWVALAGIPLLLMVYTVSLRRFFAGGISPLSPYPSEAFIIDTRVLTNTLEQTFLFVVGSLALATLLPAAQLKLIGVLTTAFILARVLFWVGYHRHHLGRSPGMAVTLYINTFIILAVAYFLAGQLL